MAKAFMALAGAALVVAAVPAAAQDFREVGITSAVARDVTGTIEGNTRNLVVGSDVHQDEEVKTAIASTAQLLFLDETTLSVGPSSQVVLDTYVYDPDSNTGKVVINATLGAFRFATGSAPSESYEIRTPVATIGVRGTFFDFAINKLGQLVLILIEGAVDIHLETGEIVTVDRPGDFVLVGLNGVLDGPREWDGGVDVVSWVSFPLFGQYYIGDKGFDFDTPYDARDINAGVDPADIVPTDTPSFVNDDGVINDPILDDNPPPIRDD